MAKILVVEDEKDLLNILKMSLEAQGHKVDVSVDGADAIEKLKHFKFDLVILDWQLPSKTGIEVLSQFRNGGGQTPILMLTGRNQATDKAEGLDTGADDYLTKPFDERELDARVRALLRRPHTFTGTVLALGDITAEQDTRRVYKSGKEIVLLPLEYNLLEFFIETSRTNIQRRSAPRPRLEDRYRGKRRRCSHRDKNFAQKNRQQGRLIDHSHRLWCRIQSIGISREIVIDRCVGAASVLVFFAQLWNLKPECGSFSNF